MISLATFYPEHFNNNGDQGNLEVLGWLFKLNNLEFEISREVRTDSDFVLIGDASTATLEHYQARLLELLPMLANRLEAGLPTLLVGSSYEWFLARLPTLGKPTKGVRKSSFIKVKAGISEPVIGYRNSELLGVELFISGAFIGTQLFGPILAKNPALLNLVLVNLGCTLTLPVDVLELINQVRDRTTFE